MMLCDSTRVRKARYAILKKEHAKLEHKVGKEVRFNSNFLDTVILKNIGNRSNQVYVEHGGFKVVSTVNDCLKKELIKHVSIHETYRNIDWSPIGSVKKLIGRFNNV